MLNHKKGRAQGRVPLPETISAEMIKPRSPGWDILAGMYLDIIEEIIWPAQLG